MERGDTGLGGDAYGSPRRRRFGDRRGRGHRDGAQRAGANAVRGAEDDYGQLLRRPGEMPVQQQWLHEPDRPRASQPDRFPQSADRPSSGPPPSGPPPSGPPPSGPPPSGGRPNGFPPSGGRPNAPPPSGGRPNGFPPSGGRPNAPPPGGLRPNGGRANGGFMPGRPYQRPDGRQVPPDADRLYRPPAPGPADGNRGRPGAAQSPDPLGPERAGRPPRAPGTPPPGVPGSQQAYAEARRGPAGPRPGGPDGWERPGGVRGAPVPPESAAGPVGPVIRLRETTVRQERPTGATQSVASIAPDGLQSFARDLRALRAKAELDYPQMAELSHFTMKTLASAAGGLRLPTLPVAVAYVRACGGNVAEWEERWQKLAAKITSDAAKKRRSEDEEQAPPEPADPPASQEPPTASAAAQDPGPDPGEVYVITSARPPRETWGDGPGGPGGTGGG